MLYSSVAAAIGVSYSMLMFAEVDPGNSIAQLFLNNFEFGLIFGAISLMLLPKGNYKPMLPEEIFRSKTASRFAYFLLLLPLIIFAQGLFSEQGFTATDAGLILPLISVSLALGIALLPAYRPEASKDSEMLKTSIRLRIFMYFITAVMLIAFTLLLVFFGFYSKVEPDTMRLWNVTYIAAGISLNFIMLISVVILRNMEKRSPCLYTIWREPFRLKTMRRLAKMRWMFYLQRLTFIRSAWRVAKILLMNTNYISA